MRGAVCLAVFLTFAGPLAAGDTWPQFRGPAANGHTDAAKLPLTWSEARNVVWKTPLPGRAWSSPVIHGHRLWLTNAPEDGKWMSAVCVDCSSGKIVHSIRLFDIAKPEPRNPLNSYASPTPVVEAGRVWVHFGSYGTACLDSATGRTLWVRRDLKCDHGVGPGSSPVLAEDKLILTFDGMDVQFLVALDKATGKTLWKTARTTKFGRLSDEMRKAFSTPTVIEAGGRRQVVSAGAGAAFAYDPATGEELWKVRYANGFSGVMRPIFAAGLVFVNSGFSKPRLLAVRPTGRGDLTDTHVAYTLTADIPIMSSPAVADELMVLVSDQGVLSCVELKTGTRVWRQRIGGSYSASPIIAPGRIYFFDHRSKCTVIRPGRTFEQLAVNNLADGCMASPAVAGHALYIRTRSALYRIEERAGNARDGGARTASRSE
ncbi:PQQ-like beta-propeller repeat protein [bacterium]|nr:PQQ-like beta-propeller repeat protein [bacterium]